jgi:hypothetical protein
MNELQYSLPCRWTLLKLVGAQFVLCAQLARIFLPPYCYLQFPHSQVCDGMDMLMTSDNSLKMLIFYIKVSIIILYYNLILAFYI